VVEFTHTQLETEEKEKRKIPTINEPKNLVIVLPLQNNKRKLTIPTGKAKKISAKWFNRRRTMQFFS